MATKLERVLKREIEIDGKPHMLTIDSQGLKLTEKGRRKGVGLLWKELANGEAALAAALNACLGSS